MACELSNQVEVFDLDRTPPISLQNISTLPEDYMAENTVADIHLHPNGNYVYVSNRGHNSLVTFKVLNDGRLKVIQHISTNGLTPRNFLISKNGETLIVANQDSDNLISFIVEGDSLMNSGIDFKLSTPVCLKEI